MNTRAIVIVLAVACIPLWFYAAVRWWKTFNSPDGERYRKRRMQGSFVPLAPDDAPGDEVRKR